jgi:hypothetical protein
MGREAETRDASSSKERGSKSIEIEIGGDFGILGGARWTVYDTLRRSDQICQTEEGRPLQQDSKRAKVNRYMTEGDQRRFKNNVIQKVFQAKR